MKVNEILNEGPLDYVGGLLRTGSRAGGRDASQQAAANKKLLQYVEKVMQSWNKHVGETGRKDVVAWANKFFDGDTSQYAQGLQNTPDGIRNFLTNVTRAYKAEELPPLQGAGQPEVAQQTTPRPGVQQPQITDNVKLDDNHDLLITMPKVGNLTPDQYLRSGKSGTWYRVIGDSTQQVSSADADALDQLRLDQTESWKIVQSQSASPARPSQSTRRGNKRSSKRGRGR